MVSFQASSLSPSERRDQVADSPQNFSKKRKWEEEPHLEELMEIKPSEKPDSAKSILDIELHLDTPLPLEWQRFLDIQSGQIHFYNTRTHKRTSKDPRNHTEPQTSPVHAGLDLELNLTCESLGTNHRLAETGPPRKHNSGGSVDDAGAGFGLFVESSGCTRNSDGLKSCPSWMQQEVDRREMMAAVCTRCHLLVMLCKSYPSCPNCKFMHSPESQPSNPIQEEIRPLLLAGYNYKGQSGKGTM